MSKISEIVLNPGDVNKKVMIQAKKDGLIDSDIATYIYNVYYGQIFVIVVNNKDGTFSIKTGKGFPLLGFDNEPVFSASDELVVDAIYYTTDGTTPTAENGTLYDGEPVEFTETITVKVLAIKENWLSGMATRELEALPDTLIEAFDSENNLIAPIPHKGYNYWVFTQDSGTVHVTGTPVVDLLLVGGGGSGGANAAFGAGGGGGGLIHLEDYELEADTYAVAVGAGGNIGGNGGNTVFGELTALGGGGGSLGGSAAKAGNDGGSGGGGGGRNSATNRATPGGESTQEAPGVGHAGGSGSTMDGSIIYAAGGGGGAGEPGGNATNGVGGGGGDGLQIFTGFKIESRKDENDGDWYAGGGRGTGSSSGATGLGSAGALGCAGTGGGGNGAISGAGYAGGSGIAIIRMEVAE